MRMTKAPPVMTGIGERQRITIAISANMGVSPYGGVRGERGLAPRLFEVNEIDGNATDYKRDLARYHDNESLSVEN